MKKMEFLLSRFLLPLSIIIFCLITTVAAALPSNETDRAGLLAFKAGLNIDSYKSLSSWNNSSPFCKWEGVTCGRMHQRVVSLDLRDRGLLGPFSPHLTNLTFLRKIYFQDNHFQGELPLELGRLRRLRVLNLTHNDIEGEVPSNLSYCSDLRVLSLGYNLLTGELPTELTSLKRLQLLRFTANQLRGAILPSVGNLSSLVYLSFSMNSFSGPIPRDLGGLQNLRYFYLSVNFLSGTVPHSLYNISSLEELSLSMNQLHGSLLPELGFLLPKLKRFLVAENHFSGPIPVSLSNASSLWWIDLSDNSFSGKVHTNPGMLQELQHLKLSYNEQLGQGQDLSLISHLTNCTGLRTLGLMQNSYSGRIPESIYNLSTQLRWLTLGSNEVIGEISARIEKLVGLEVLAISGSSLTGNIPDGIGMLPKLHKLSLFGTDITGQISSSLCNISCLLELDLGSNSLQGTIPSTIGNCQRLHKLYLGHNKLNGTIPKEIFSITSLSIALDISHNSFSGSLPIEIGNLKNLGEFYADNNKLSGEIPITLGSCESLEILSLGNNLLQGTIPSSLSNMRTLKELDLSKNNLTGHIPEYLGKFPFLQSLNLSFNNFDGEVPNEGIFVKNISGFSVRGNSRVCGGTLVLQLPTCPKEGKKERKRSRILKLIIPMTVSFALASVAIFLAMTYWTRRLRKVAPSSVTCFDENHPMISYKDLSKATNGFSVENLIGSGRYSSVYKGKLEQGRVIVAVKVLSLQVLGASSTFIAECNAFRNIRHRNIAKTITSCSSVDDVGNDFKALIFRYMTNGSLDMWLHQLKSLNLLTRLNIAIDVASALDYLHNQCQTPIVHCDLKPCNILLDDEMSALVTDFGLAKFLYEAMAISANKQSSTIAIQGTIGYVPPEYGAGADISVLGDVYSYGILLLELFTGKRPTDNILNGLTLRQYVQMAIPMRVLEILDPALIAEIEIPGDERVIKCVSSVLNVGISCSAQSPNERMKIGRVLGELHGSRMNIVHNVRL